MERANSAHKAELEHIQHTVINNTPYQSLRLSRKKQKH